MGERARDELERFQQEERWWLDDYALFRALHASYQERSWTEWPQALRSRELGRGPA